MTEATLSVARGFGAASGIAATVTYPWLQQRVGERSTLQLTPRQPPAWIGGLLELVANPIQR